MTKGTTLLTYDTTLSQLSLDRKDLEIQRAKLRLEDAQDQLAEIKKMKPISYSTTTRPTTKPTTRPTTKPASQVPSEELGERRFLDLGGAGTAGDPKVLWVRQSQTFDDALIAEILDGAESLYTILEVRQNDRAAGTLLSRTGVYFQAVQETVGAASATTTAAEGGSYGVHLLSEVTTAPSDAPTDEPSSEPSTDPSEEPTQPPTEEPTEPDPPPTTEPVPPTTPSEPALVTRYVFTFFQVSQKQEDDEDDDAGSDISSGSGSSVDMNSGYTANEIAQMRSDKEAEIKDLQFSIKMAEAEYKIMKKEFDNGEVKSEVDGYVVSVQTPEEALANNEPVVKVSGGGGFFIQGSVGELNRNEIEIGQTVQVMSYNTGESFEGTITAVGDYPLTGTWYSGDGNPTVSYYPFTVTIDESATWRRARIPRSPILLQMQKRTASIWTPLLSGPRRAKATFMCRMTRAFWKSGKFKRARRFGAATLRFTAGYRPILTSPSLRCGRRRADGAERPQRPVQLLRRLRHGKYQIGVSRNLGAQNALFPDDAGYYHRHCLHHYNRFYHQGHQ